MWQSLKSSSYLVDVRATFIIAGLGFLFSILVGVGVAVLLYFSPWLKKMVTPLLLFSQNIPIIVLAPLLVIWFGFGVTAKLFVVVLVCFFPITISLLDAFEQVNHNLLRYMEMSGATKWEKFRYLVFPSAIPVLFSSCKLSATYSVMGAVVAEWLGTEHGIGMVMTQSASSFRTDRVFVAILTIVCLSACFYICIRVLENWWKHKRKWI
ncbi:ABC transporter permease [Shimazuella kribbensis]|uniref:ABC transporter permease n=1 Tax=Shimazuella kribbensis TaxID=139808 RepID=UPI000414E625|nr:ABC transporter permease [Shimazuella kribbensis]